jgi:hypothetical protein
MEESLAAWYVLGAMIYLIVCAVAGKYVAVQKGRPEGEGILFGILFGPLGLILVACLPDGPARVQAAAGPAPAPEVTVTPMKRFIKALSPAPEVIEATRAEAKARAEAARRAQARAYAEFKPRRVQAPARPAPAPEVTEAQPAEAQRRAEAARRAKARAYAEFKSRLPQRD